MVPLSAVDLSRHPGPSAYPEGQEEPEPGRALSAVPAGGTIIEPGRRQPTDGVPNITRGLYACHEGNYALSNILSGERYQERLEAGEEPNRR